MTVKRFKYGVSALDIVFAGAAAAIIVWLGASLGGTASASSEEGRQIAEQAVRRAALTCYAIEGCYPPDYAYLADNYNVVVDKNKYAVHYEIFASNVMPEISVLALGGGN